MLPPPELVLTLVILGELVAEEAECGEEECRTEYLDSSWRLLLWAMLKGCLLFRDIIIMLSCGGGAQAPLELVTAASA